MGVEPCDIHSRQNSCLPSSATRAPHAPQDDFAAGDSVRHAADIPEIFWLCDTCAGVRDLVITGRQDATDPCARALNTIAPQKVPEALTLCNGPFIFGI